MQPVMGVFDHCSHLFHLHRGGKKKTTRDGGDKGEDGLRRMREEGEEGGEGVKGVTQVETEPKKQKLTVVGYVEPEKVLHRVRRRTGKKAEFWPYVPAEVVGRPYVAGVYDKKAPPGFVRNVVDNPGAPSNIARASSTEVKYLTAFSDDNPNACAIM